MRGVAPRHFKNAAELCMALTVASRHYVPKAPVRLHKAVTTESLLLKEGASVEGGR